MTPTSSDAAALPGAVLLDMDGTLTDSEKWWFRGEAELLAEYGVEWTEELAKEVVGCPIDWWASTMVERFGLPARPEDVARDLVARVHGIVSREPAQWRPGARELLELLARLAVPSAVVTSSPQAIARAALREAPAGSLAVFVTGDEDLAGKPSPEPYERAAGRLGVDPADCVVFEDSLFGVRSALAARTHAVVVPFMADIPPLPGLLRIDSLDGLDARALSRFAAQPLPAGDPLA